MGFNLNKVWMIRWWFRWWLYWWWCPQKISTFGFSSSATVNEEFQWDLNPILPTIFSSPQTHYSVAIIKALQLIVRYSKMNQCLLIFSDGGDNSFDSAEIEIWNFVRRNCLECDLCVQCFFMRNFRNQQVPNNYMNTCRQLGSGQLGVVFAHESPWTMATSLRQLALRKIWNQQCPCRWYYYGFRWSSIPYHC